MGALLATLCLVLTWELMTPDGNTDGTQSPDPAVPTMASHATATAPARPAAADHDAAALARIAGLINERPLFSPSRRPSERPATATAQAAASEGLPRLTGTIVGPSGARAIFAGSDGKSHAAAEGDVVGAFKVREIGPGQVILAGSDGEHVLRPTYIVAPVTSAAGGVIQPAAGGPLRPPPAKPVMGSPRLREMPR